MSRLTEEQQELAQYWHECLMADLECIRLEAEDKEMKIEHIVLMRISPIGSRESRHSMHMQGSYDTTVRMLMDMLQENPEVLLMLSKSILQHKNTFLGEAWANSTKEHAAKGFEAVVKSLNDK